MAVLSATRQQSVASYANFNVWINVQFQVIVFRPRQSKLNGLPSAFFFSIPSRTEFSPLQSEKKIRFLLMYDVMSQVLF